MTNCVCTMLRTVVVCAFYVGLTRSAPSSDKTGYNCNNIPDVKECTISHRYCYLHGSAYVPCFRICQIEVYHTMYAERCQPHCSEYFTKECKPVYPTSKVTPVSSTPFSSTSTAMPCSSMELWVIGLIVGAVIIGLIVLCVAIICYRNNNSTNHNDDKLLQVLLQSQSRAGTPGTTGASSTANGITPSANGGTPMANGSKPTPGDGSTPMANGSTPTAGDGSTPTANGSTPTAGDGSTPTANGSTPTAGDGSTPTAGDGSTPTGETDDDAMPLITTTPQPPISTPLQVSEFHNQQPTSPYED